MLFNAVVQIHSPFDQQEASKNKGGMGSSAAQGVPACAGLPREAVPPPAVLCGKVGSELHMASD